MKQRPRYVKSYFSSGNDLQTVLLLDSAFPCIFSFFGLASSDTVTTLMSSHSASFLPFFEVIPEIFRKFASRMIADELTYRIRQTFGFEPTAEQSFAIDVFSRFLTDRSDRVVMILRGSAGTGKTTLAGAMVRGTRRAAATDDAAVTDGACGKSVLARFGTCGIHHTSQHLPPEIDGRRRGGFRS